MSKTIELDGHSLHDRDLEVGRGELQRVAVLLEEDALEDRERALARNGAAGSGERFLEVGGGDGELHGRLG